MALAELLEETPRKRAPGRRPKLLAYYESLNDTDRAAFDKWVASGLSTTDLWKACVADGLELALPTFHQQLRHNIKGGA